jgi:histidinol-phosphatase (PHP family)
MEAYVLEAIQQGFSSIGISSHASTPVQMPWSMGRRQWPQYLQDLMVLKGKYAREIEVYAGLEVDYVPGISWWDFHGSAIKSLDYVIGSVHLVDAFADGTPWEIDGDHPAFMKGLNEIFHGDVQVAVSRYFELMRWMLMLENPDVLGHMDKIKVQNIQGKLFSEGDLWYKSEIDKTLKVASTMGTIVEINTRGWYSGRVDSCYPSPWILERMAQMKIPVTISSDAHRPEEISAGIGFAVETLLGCGYKSVVVLENGKWTPQPLNNGALSLLENSKGSQNRIA